MTKASPDDLERAALYISSESLEAAKKAIAIDCTEYLNWTEVLAGKANVFSSAGDIKKLAKATALTMLGYLPTKPTTCPFCIQHSEDSTCKGCGYAQTHGGRCDEESSAFCRFIEAFHCLGKDIYQDHCPDGSDPFYISLEESKRILLEFIDSSATATYQFLEDLPDASILQLMEIKSLYLASMIEILPASLFSKEVQVRCQQVKEALKEYW
jgi:hypothetical protein